jgi:fermentation-respiration switch protein FrsA (DUF1100 family)
MPGFLKRMMTLIAAGLVLGYLLIVAAAYLRQDRMLYFPTNDIESTPNNIGLEYDDLTLKTKDGLDISAWHVPVEDARGTVLFCHGNAGNISLRLDSIRIFHGLGLGVLIFDYRGYGKSQGHPDEKGTYMDAEAAWAYIVDTLGVKPENVVIFGRSLGGGVAAEMALRKQSGVLIIESGFTSVPDLGKKFFPYLPVRLISRHKYETIDKVDKIKIPKLFVHSPEDEIVPYGHGTKLFKRASEPKDFLRIKGDHNDGFMLSGKVYVEGLRDFLDKYLAPL